MTILVGPHWIVVCDGYTDTVYYIDGGSTRAPYCVHNDEDTKGRGWQISAESPA